MAEYRHVRCLFCFSGKEETVVRFIRDNGWGQALFPQRVKTVLRNREWQEELSPLLPGYVFWYTAEERPECRSRLNEIPYVMKLLRYQASDTDEIRETLVGNDRIFADWIWRLDGKIGRMKAMAVGDRIEIIDGLFKELKGTIRKMDRRRQTMLVEIDAQGTVKQVWLSYEVVERLETDDPSRTEKGSGAK